MKARRNCWRQLSLLTNEPATAAPNAIKSKAG
jgi:hypothetical protein